MTPNSTARHCTAIRGVIRLDWSSYVGRGVYGHLADIWEISSATAWRLINVKNYWPASKRIQKVLRDRAKERGIEIVNRKRVRVDLDPNTGKEELEAIRELTAQERTEALIIFKEEK